jgi:ribonuclease E
MATEPTEKKVRARRKKVAATDEVTASSEVKPKRAAKAVPVPMFQAPAVTKKSVSDDGSEKPASRRKKSAPSSSEAAAPSRDGASEDQGSRDPRRRRRRRGGRNRHREGDSSQSDSSMENEGDSEEGNEGSDSGEPRVRKRRKRVRPGQDAPASGEVVDEDGVVTVVKVREKRESRTSTSRTREKRDDFRRRGARPQRGFREGYRDNYRENRRRGVILTEGEFLARRESVEREMIVRQKGDRTQIAVVEDKILVEHYVNRNSNVSYVGNVYLGKVQNVLPSMEAAFVDIGKGRNAVLYAGEVNWDEAGLSENQEKKIEHVLKSGQMIMVQVTKDPIGQKGARLTSQVSLPGRFVVFVPGGEMSGISRKLPENERARLKSILGNLIAEDEGVIVRTAAEGASEEELTRDVARLKAQWEDIKKKSEKSEITTPTQLYGEPDLTVRVVRDLFNADFNRLIIQGDSAFEDISNYLGHVAPELMERVSKYTGTSDLFTEYNVDEQLSKALDRKVYLPSGGSLVIDRTEAMVVIDVNTGKFIGKGGNLEETVTKNNLEAAEEIARQLRLRDLGGIIVIDFIDMVLESNREQVLRRLVECLGRDRTKHQVAEVTSLGLVQMTRKRIGQGLIEAFSTTCDSCGGRGIHIHSDPVNKRTVDREIGNAGEDLPTERNSKKKPLKHPVDRVEKTSESESEAALVSEAAEGKEEESGKRPFGRRRRRAVSTGVITAE